MGFPPKRIIKRRDSSKGDPVADVYALPALTGTVLTDRPARNRHHPHPTKGDFYRVQGQALNTLPRLTAPVKPHGTERHRKALEANLALLPAEAQRSEDEIYDDLIEAGETTVSAAHKAHQELAAQVLAVGGTYADAADRAGVNEETIRGYMEIELFCERIVELRGHTMTRIAGNVVTELERRTEPGRIALLETIDVLRIYDRTAGPKGGGASAIPGVNVNVQINSYQDLMARITDVAAFSDADAEGESGDFPAYGADVVPVPGGSSQRIGTVSRARLGSSSREKPVGR